ncbi:hypothetical protein KKE03_03680 [Patescibacteria group bacterium]|nr:hypothetical protein [Patescibacteria group bacterium]
MNQKGLAHIFLILFLVAGLAVAVYLVQQKTNILPKAYEQGETTTNCEARVVKFSVDRPCTSAPNGFKTATYSCKVTVETQITEELDNQNLQSLSIQEETCRSLDDWVSRAKDACWARCPSSNSSPMPTPIITVSPVPISAPSGPTGLKGICSYSPRMQAKLSWNPVPGITEYTVYVTDVSKINTDYGVPLPDITTANTSITIGTHAGHIYTWSVSVSNSVGGAGSGSSSFECPPAPQQ